MRRLGVPATAALAGLLLQLALAGGALAGAGEALRVALACVALVLLPGHGWLAAIGARPPGGRLLASGWALGLGVAWLGLLVMVTRLAHAPFTVLAHGALLPNLLPWAIAALRRPAPAENAPGRAELSRLAVLAIALAAVVACVHVARLPTPVGFDTDSPDHIGTIRRMIAEGDAFPLDAFFRDAGPLGADPRKGLWHACVALIALLAHADPLVAWRALTLLLAPAFVLNAAAFGALVAGSAGAGVAAWALLLTYGRSLAVPPLREAVFATKLADQLALAAATAVLADLDQRRAASRLAALGLALGAVATHVFAALQLAVVLGALAVGLLVRDRGLSPALRRLVVTAGVAGVACLPYALWRQHAATAPHNLIHTEPQGLLLLGHGLRVVTISVLWDWLGPAWLLVPLSWWAWARAAARPAVLYLLTTTLAVTVLLFCPPVVALLQPGLGYLMMRLVWLVPLTGALAFALPALVRRAASARGGARLTALAALAGLALLLAPALRDDARLLADPGRMARSETATSAMPWRDALAWANTHLPAGTVVLSDPATCYTIPMLTRHWVTTLVDQHSSPNDSLALARILDARDALDPAQPYARLRAVVRRWGATAIVLNDRFVAPPWLDYWAPNPGWFLRARARLDAVPAAFPRLYDTRDFVIYGVVPAALDTLQGGGCARACVRLWRGGLAGGAPATVPDVVACTLSRDRVRPDDTLDVELGWHVRASLPAGSYHVSLRFDRALPGGASPPAWCAKPVRKLLEALRHERYRFRSDHLPVEGDYGVDLWRTDEVVLDRATVHVPPDMAGGDYAIEATMLRQPHYPNLTLADYFFDHDYYSGVRVGTLHVVRGASAPRGAAGAR